MVITPKVGGTKFRIIRLLEVLWKAIYRIINCQLSSFIQFHEAHYVICAGRGTGTASLEAKLLLKLIAMRETVLHAIFLDLCNAFDALDREHYLDILTVYKLEPRTISILQTYWFRLQMVAKVGGHYGPAFQSHHEITHADSLSPIIFNMVVEAVIQHWVTVVVPPQEGTRREGLGMSVQALSSIFYADDRLVASTKSALLQGAFNALEGLFNQMGLRKNEGKTVSMACWPCHTPHSWSTEVYT